MSNKLLAFAGVSGILVLFLCVSLGSVIYSPMATSGKPLSAPLPDNNKSPATTEHMAIDHKFPVTPPSTAPEKHPVSDQSVVLNTTVVNKKIPSSEVLVNKNAVPSSALLMNFAPVKIFPQFSSANATQPSTTILGLSPVTFGWFMAATVTTAYLVFKEETGQQNKTKVRIPILYAPVASFTVNPISGNINTTVFSFDASASFDSVDGTGPNSTLQVRWSFNDDGTWNTNFSTNKIVTTNYVTAGTKRIRLEVLNRNGLTNQTTQIVSVDGPPTPYFTITPLTGTITTTIFTFDASGSSDVEDGTGPGSPLRVRWSFNNDGIWNTTYSTTKVVTTTYTTPGTKTVLLDVLDTGGLTSQITQTLYANSPPVPAFTVSPPITNAINTYYLFDASGSTDLEDATALLQVRWFFNWTPATPADTAFTAVKTAAWRYSTYGPKTVGLEVRDTMGASTLITRTLFVNDYPTPLFTVTPITGVITTTVFTVDASTSSDLDDGTGASSPLRVRWIFDYTSVTQTFDTVITTTKVATTTYSTAGNKTILLEVTDTSGFTATTTATISVNALPIASFVITPTAGGRNTVYTFDASPSADAKDGTGYNSALQVRWSWENNGIWDYPTTGYVLTKTATHQYTSVGTRTIRLEIIDSVGLTATTTLPLSIGSGILVTSPSPMFREGPQHTGQSLYSASITTPTLRWVYTTTASAPVISSVSIGSNNNTLYVGSDDKTLSAINALSGTLIWKYTAVDKVRSTPAIDVDGIIYFIDHSDWLYSLNPDGTLRWTTNLGTGLPRSGTIIDSSPAIGPNGMIYVGTSNFNRLYAVRDTGIISWYFQLDKPIDASPAVGTDGTVYVSSDNNHIYAIDANGNQKWNYNLGAISRSSPAVGPDGTVYVGTNGGTLFALSQAGPVSGTFKWQYSSGINDIVASPAVGNDGIVYFGTNGSGATSNFFAVNPNGSQRWIYATGAQIISSPIIGADGSIYVTDDSGTLWAFRSDGTVRWNYRTAGATLIHSSPVIDTDGTVYIGDNNGAIYALEYPSLGGVMASPNPMFHHDIWHTGHSQYYGPLNNALRWTYLMGNITESSPAIDMAGNIYIGCRDGKLYVVDLYGGLKWTYQTGGAINSSPALGRDGTVYVGSDDNYVYAIKSDGTLKWRFLTGGVVFSSPAVARDGTIYVGSEDGRLYALNANGTAKWTYNTTYVIIASPAISQDMSTIYVAWCNDPTNPTDGRLIAVNASNGSLKWSYNTGFAMRSSPTISSNGRIFIGDDGGRFYCITDTGGSGATVWGAPGYFQTGSEGGAGAGLIITTAALDEGPETPITQTAVYFGSYNGRLYCLNRDTGALKWFNGLGSFVHSSPLVDLSGFVYACSRSPNPRVYCFNSSGVQQWTYQVTGNIRSSPAITADGSLVVAAEDMKIYLIGRFFGGLSSNASYPKFHYNQPQTGLTPWNAPTTNTGIQIWSGGLGAASYCSPAIAPDGTVYIGSQNGYLRAVTNLGVIRWTYPLTGTIGAVQSSPCIGADGTIYFGDMGGRFYALNPDGSLRWMYPPAGNPALAGGIYSSPTLDTVSNVYFGCLDGGVYSLNARGKQRWAFMTAMAVESSPAITTTAGLCYIGSNDGNLYAINSNGTEAWRFITSPAGAIKSSPAVAANGNIYFTSNNGYVYGIDSNGNLLAPGWPQPLAAGGLGYSSPALDLAGNVYLGAPNGTFYSFQSNGTPRWSYATGAGAIQSSPVIANNGYVYFGTYTGGGTGARLWCLATSGQGPLWAQGYGAFVWAYPNYNPSPPWPNFGYQVTWGTTVGPLGDSIHSSPALGRNFGPSTGKVVFAGFDGNLYSIGNDPADVTIAKVANKHQVTVGDVITYKVTITNKGIDPTNNLTIIRDQIPAGFKYIKGSTILDGVKVPDPTGNKILDFSVSTITANGGTKVLSYQLVVGSGVTFGKYQNRAVCYYYDVVSKTSNTATETVLVVPDPLFDLGTIIGKVFVDKNGNGIQDDGEQGIGDARIVMEDGTIVTTDKDGKYHIPGVIPGIHLLKLDTIPAGTSTGGDNGTVVGVGENPRVVRVTDGLLCKVNFAVRGTGGAGGEEGSSTGQSSGTVKVGQSNFTLVLLGDGVAGNNKATGELGPVKPNHTLQDGFYSQGRVAGYLKTKQDDYLITASLDTNRDRNRELMRYIDPNKYYLTYGDNSTISWDATNTQGPVYLSVQHIPTDSSFLLGNYPTKLDQTELLTYNRTLYGVKLELNSTTGANAQPVSLVIPNTNLKVFGAKAYQIAAHNELRATGGSLYYLRNKNLVAGSEQVTIIARDKITNLTINTQSLARQTDYQIDYTNGRIILNQPVNSVSDSTSIISTNILNGNPVYIVVDYEYEPDSLDFSQGTYGGRVTYAPTKGIIIGASAVSEEEDTKDYSLKGADVGLELPAGTRIKGEYAESTSRGITNDISQDGGLSFNTVANGPTTEGSAYQIKLESKPFSSLDTGAYYQRLRPGFISSGSFTQQGTEKYGLNVVERLNDHLSIVARYDLQELLPQFNLVSGALVGGQKTEDASLQGNYNINRFTFTGEYRYQTVTDKLANITSETNRDTSVGALRAGYQLSDMVKLFLEQQGTLKGPPNYQTTLGANLRLNQNFSGSLQGTSGTAGNSFLAGLNTQVSPTTQVYTNFSYGISRGDQPVRTSTTASGVTSQVTPGTKVYAEKQYQTTPNSIATADAVGQETQLDKKWRLGISLERGIVNNFTGPDTVRKSGSVNAAYNDNKKFKFTSKVEGRQDDGLVDRKQYTTAHNLQYQLTPDFSLLGRFNWSETKNDTSNTVESLFNETELGMAFRPVSWDKLNLIAKYTYLINNHPTSQLFNPAQIDPLDITKERASVYAAEGAYDFPWCQLVAKYAFKNGKEKVGPRDYTDSDTILYLGRVNYHLINKIDTGLEYRVLRQKLADDQKSGYLFELLYKMNDYAYFGVGYNFTDFTDDLINNNDYRIKGPFIRFVGAFGK